MKYRNLMTATAAIAFICGILFCFAGAELIPHFHEGEAPPHSVPSHPKWIALSLGRMFGAALALTGIIAWTMRNLERAEDQRNMTRAFFVGGQFMLIIAVIQQMTIWETTGAWFFISLISLITCGFGYLLFWEFRMDLLMPGGMDGVEATRKIRARSPRTQVVALTASIDEARMIGVLRAGAIGYVRKDAEPEILLAAVRAAAAGRPMIDPAAAGDALQDFARGQEPGSVLTERELEVLRSLARGFTNREIAEALFISEETVKTHISNILGKLRLTHRTQVVIYALKQNLVSLDEL